MFLTEKLVDKVIDISTVGYRLIVIKILVQKKEEKGEQEIAIKAVDLDGHVASIAGGFAGYGYVVSNKEDERILEFVQL